MVRRGPPLCHRFNPLGLLYSYPPSNDIAILVGVAWLPVECRRPSLVVGARCYVVG
ncbi:hypothetical protein L195_g040234, partial [Trifolium pratense]